MKRLTLCVVAMLSLTGCSGDGTPQITAHDDSTYADDRILYGVGSANFPTESSPAAVAAREEYVVYGTVDGFEDGRKESSPGVVPGTTEEDLYVVIRLKVEEVAKGGPRGFESGFAYVTRPRGVQTLDSKGNLVEGGDVATPIGAFEKEIPIGSRILVMASPNPSSLERGVNLENARAGVPDPSSPILNVYNPQTILLDGGPTSGLFGWQDDPDLTFDKALAEVRNRLTGKG